MKNRTTWIVTVAVGFGLMLGPVLAYAADPAVKCESGKLKEAGKYASCRLSAESKAAKKGVPADYSRCVTKFSGKWSRLEARGAGACPSNGDEVSIDARITTDEAEVATLLAGGTVPECGNDVVDGEESCDGTDLVGQDCVGLGYASGTLDCTAGCGYDVSACTPYPPPSLCGNGVFDPGEDCELGTLNGEDCVSRGYAGGALRCTPVSCTFDTRECTRRVFVTSTLYDGNLGGLAGASSICQSRAVAAGFTGTYLSWLSDQALTPDATFTHGSGAYVLVDGTLIATSWADLVDGSIAAGINIDENGNLVSAPPYVAWTNTWPDGMLFSADPATTCAGFTSNNPASVAQAGHVNTTGLTWSATIAAPCDMLLHLYCFEQ